MGWLWDELVQRAGPQCEQQVRASAERWRDRIEPSLRDLTALKLTFGKYRASIAIKINPGLPEHLRVLDQDLANFDNAVLGLYKRDIEHFIHHGEQLQIFLCRSAELNPTHNDESDQQIRTIESALEIARSLQVNAVDDLFLSLLFQYNQDCLGVYCYHTHSQDGWIELYWGVIGAVAQQLVCSVDTLTGMTLIHEMAHAYTHLGADIEGRRWSSSSFHVSSDGVIEGLAQYYLAQIGNKLMEKGEPDVLNAYEALLKHQNPIYKAHLPWVNNYSPEIVRAALLESRASSRGVTLDLFETAMQSALIRLSQGQQLSLFPHT